MTKAEEIANQCAIKEEWFYGPLIKSINEALEWAARQCDQASDVMEADPDNEFDGMDTMDVVGAMANRIRAGKST